MNLANKITVVRVCMIPLFLVALLVGTAIFKDEMIARLVAVGIFILASATDALDGYIARSRNLITNFGKFADPLADKLLVAAALIAMVELRMLPSWVVIIIISREFIITGFRQIASDKGVVLAASIWGKAKTVSQMVMIVVVMLQLGYSFMYIINAILIFGATLLTIISGVAYIVKNKEVLKD